MHWIVNLAIGFPLILAAGAMGVKAHQVVHVGPLTPHGVCPQNFGISPQDADTIPPFYDRVSPNRNLASLSSGYTLDRSF